MYVPTHFSERDPVRLRQFIAEHGFATLISSDTDEPAATHLPLLLDLPDDQPRKTAPTDGGSAPDLADPFTGWRLIGHFARANPQWRSLSQQRVLAIFHGPHAYISPSWYETPEAVPTWNYAAVHVTGTARLLESPTEIRQMLERLSDKYEFGRPNRWSMSAASNEYLVKLMQAIVPFEILVERIEGKWKLSQNHPEARRLRIIAALQADPQPDAARVAELMHHTLPSAGNS